MDGERASPDDLRRWVENQRAAAEREREAARDGAFARDPIRAEVRRREDEVARERWTRLREALGAR